MGLVCIQNESLLVYSKSQNVLVSTVSAQQGEEQACGRIPPVQGSSVAGRVEHQEFYLEQHI